MSGKIPHLNAEFLLPVIARRKPQGECNEKIWVCVNKARRRKKMLARFEHKRQLLRIPKQPWRLHFSIKTGAWHFVGDTLMQTRMNRTAYRSAIGVALAAAFILIWLSLGVGIIGKDGDPANLMYFGVLAVGIIGAVIARLRPRGMARALFAAALAQTLVAGIALIAGLGLPWSGPAEILMLNGFFIALFAGSAWLFLRAAHERPERGDS